MEFNERGEELPDNTPVEIPAGFKRPESLTEQIRRLIRTEFSREALDTGKESWEDANDFEVEDEDFESRVTQYEEKEMTPEVPYERVDRSKEGAAGSVGGKGGESVKDDARKSGGDVERDEQEGVSDSSDVVANEGGGAGRIVKGAVVTEVKKK